MNPSIPTPADLDVAQKPAPSSARAAPSQTAGDVQPRRRAAAKPPGAAIKRAAARVAELPASPVKAPGTGARPRPKSPLKAETPAQAPAVTKAAKTEKPIKQVKPAKSEKAGKAEKVEKVEKAAKSAKRQQPLVRDSFTMPADDFALVGTLKARALAAQHVAKKSELLRAGLHALQAMPEDQLMATLRALKPIKLGRPKK